MNRTRTFALSLAALFAAGFALTPTDASAQVRTRRDDGYYDRGRDDRPVRDWEVRPLVDRAERQSNSFRAWYEHIYAKDRLGHDPYAHDFKRDIQHMDEAMERLRRKADDHRPGVGRDELREAIRWGSEIDREVGRNRDTRFTYREWEDLRGTLNDLAHLYDVRGV